MDVNFELYKIFYHIAREGSISKAAQKLYISQPAVSQSIRLLEDRLGGRLFLRTQKGMKLTWEGEALYKHIEPAVNFIRTGERVFTGMQDLLSGEINIGASDMTCKYYLLPFLEAFHRKYPGVRLHVTNGATPETIGLIRKGAIDFGVISLPVEPDEKLSVVECMEIQDCFVAGEKYKELALHEISIRELCSYPILLLERSTATRRYIDEFARGKGCELIPEIELATSDLLVQFARRELGIACFVRNFAEEELKAGSLYEIRLKEKIPPRKIGLAFLRDVYPTAAAGRFIEELKLEPA